jgi:hypothetical protein
MLELKKELIEALRTEFPFLLSVCMWEYRTNSPTYFDAKADYTEIANGRNGRRYTQFLLFDETGRRRDLFKGEALPEGKFWVFTEELIESASIPFEIHCALYNTGIEWNSEKWLYLKTVREMNVRLQNQKVA